MKCPNCNAEISAGISFCTSCGAKVGEQNSQKQRSKNKFLISWIVFLVVAVLVVVNTLSSINMPMYDLPLIGMVDDSAADGLKDIIDEMEDEIDFDEVYDELEEELDKEIINKSEYKKIKAALKSAEKLAKNPSFGNFRDAGQKLEELVDKMEDEVDFDEAFDELDGSEVVGKLGLDDMDDFDEAVEIFDIVIIVFWIFAAIILLFALLATAFRRFAFVIVSIIFALIFGLLFVGVVLTLLLVAALVALAVTCRMARKEMAI